jgi:thiamine-monophosphate kinase
MPGEFDFIEWLRNQQPSGNSLVATGVGDDLAVLNWPAGDLLIVGVDQVLDGVHFESGKHPPRLIGRKVMNRNLSDCAAMACLPAAAVVSAALPRGCGLDYARELHVGLREAADPFECAIVGGDTGTWDGKLALSVTILGRGAGITPIRRDGARPGDNLFVTGALGGSLVGRHMTFTPRVKLARELAQRYPITAMLDISDGLSRDLAQICRASGVGAVVDAALVPIHDDARRLDSSLQDPFDHALHDGEDHELLFTSPSPSIEGAIRIGRITQEPGLWIESTGGRQALEPRGWEHRL